MAISKTRRRRPSRGGNGARTLQRRAATLRKDAKRAVKGVGNWVEEQAEAVGKTVNQPSIMIGAMSAAAAGLLGWYLGRHSN